MELKVNGADKILDVEKFSRLYLLKNIKKLDWGYEAELTLTRFLSFKCLVYLKGKDLKIVEKNGKFIIKISVNDNLVTVDVETSNILLKETLKLRLEKNIEKYKDVISQVTSIDNSSKRKRTVFMKSVGDHLLDLRGLVCPAPEIEAKKKLMEIRIGESLEVLVDNPAAVEITLPEVAKLFNCRYEVFNMGDYVSFVFYKLSATPTRTDYVEAIESLDVEKMKELLKEGEFRAFLYVYFDKIVKNMSCYGIKREYLKHEGFGLISAAPIGRGWLLTAIADKEKILAIRLDTDEGVYFGEEALARLPKEGEVNIFYLSHNN
ncbi:sulfurtransferase TusA family protein [Stygiolobus caldivivus]|uniref:UPF0033 domain-containing protein n=1 Tax=Stygiolobus caldivivus TaxID=2824673 RepID=A0A8D5U529_9CREN|nr:sulfurtransferase TusA family protein [Stygiolobus caldivivus]BCU69084.1 hypothetical protein KN1_03810 [Stygiolobus caldivivus]